MKPARILVASDVVSDAALVRDLLRDEFGHVVVSTDPDKAVDDFERNQPAVLILAFNNLEKSERYYLGLYRLSTLVHSVAHRTLILCGKDELRRDYELCRKAYFDDYVLFWPMTNDVQRLAMAVTHALRDVDRLQSAAPTLETSQLLHRIAELEGMLEQRTHLGDHPENTANRPSSQTGAEIAPGTAATVAPPARLHLDIDALKAKADRQHFHALNDAEQPMEQWISKLKQQATQRPLVLVVDDDEFVRKLVGEMLRAQPYDLIFAASGAMALELMNTQRPDLILMDMVMPEVSGLETLRRLKTTHRLAGIPVMMITGQSEKDIVVECLKAGAVDFLVKPLDREVLQKKIAAVLGGITY